MMDAVGATLKPNSRVQPEGERGDEAFTRADAEYVVQQNSVQQRLSQLVNGGFTSSADGALALAGFRRPWRREAQVISDAFSRLTSMPMPPRSPVQRISVAPYAGNLSEISALRDFLADHLADDVAVCMLHGSLATGEEIAYSDVDALVVLKDEVVRSAQRLAHAARLLSRARTLMYAFDSLQHHGWFVLTEHDLRCHCEAYFPVVLFRYGAMLLPHGPIDIDVAVRDSRAEMLQGFRHLAAAVRSRCDESARPDDVYELKTLLSHVMLLPSMYVQLRDGEGVWKGRSFGLAEGDFSKRAWRSVETASEIRRRWPEAHGRALPPLQGPLAQKIAKRTAAGIPPALGRHLGDEFYASASALVDEMESRINEIHVCDRHGPIRDHVSC